MLQNIRFPYSIETLVATKKIYCLKVCYKEHLSFLKFQSTVASDLSNKLATRAQFKTSRFKVFKFYINLVRSNFFHKKMPISSLLLKNRQFKFFSTALKQYVALADINRVLLWQAVQVNSMFKLNISKKKKRKKIVYRTNVQYVKPAKRILTTWTWLKFFTKSVGGGSKFDQKLLISFENFLGNPQDTSVIHDIKYQVYKVKLLRSI